MLRTEQLGLFAKFTQKVHAELREIDK